MDPELQKQQDELKRRMLEEKKKLEEALPRKSAELSPAQLNLFGVQLPINPWLDHLLKKAAENPPSEEEVRKQIEGAAKAEASWKEDRTVTTRLPPNPCKDMVGRWCATHRHIKTGGLYTEVCRAILEKTLTPVVVYRGRDGTHWVRPAEEFDDEERFEVLNDGK